MNETTERNNLSKPGKVLLLLALSVGGLLLLCVLCLYIYLSTSLPAAQLSKLVTAELKQQFLVKNVRFSGRTLILEGVRLENPEGFPKGALVSADYVSVAPQWWSLLRGGQRFRLIDLQHVGVNLEKNNRGIWNFSKLQQTLAERKKPAKPVETFIGELRVKNGAVKVQGQGVQGISLRVLDLATLGSRESEFNIAFQDPAQNQYQLKGKARPGKDAALDLSLKAPSLNLEKVALLFKLNNPSLFRGGVGGLQADATLHGGELSTRGEFSFSRLQVAAAAGRSALPVEGALNFGLDYSSRGDRAKLLPSTLVVKNLARLAAVGGVADVSGRRQYRVNMTMDEVDLSILNLLLSESARKGLLYGGRLSGESFQLAGDRPSGLTAAQGTLRLKEGKVARGGDLFLEGASGTATVSRRQETILVKGNLSAPRGGKDAMFRSLELPLNLTLSRQLKLVKADFPNLSATVKGIPVRGRMSYDAPKARPLSASLQIPRTDAAAFNPLLNRYGMEAKSGTASGRVEAVGKGASDLTAKAEIELTALRGLRGKEPVAIRKGAVTANLERNGELLAADGKAALAGVTLDGKAADATFKYRLNGRQLFVSDAAIHLAQTRIGVRQLAALLPERQVTGGVSTYPLHLDLEGASLKQGELELFDLNGRLRGSFKSDSNGRWLEGAGDLGSQARWKGKFSTAPALHLQFSRAGARAKLGGKALGGTLGGSASFNPFSPASGGSFDLSIENADLSAAAPLLPAGSGVRPAAGVLDLRVEGGYRTGKPLAYRFQSKGSGIALNNAAGRSLVSNASLSVAGAMAGDRLSIDQAVLSAGPQVSLKLKGGLDQPLSPKREGTFDFSLQRATLNDLVDPFVNVLPPFIQEATVSGSMAAQGRVDLKGEQRMIRGALQLYEAGLEVPSQKLVVSGIDGTIPFSLVPSAESQGGAHNPTSFSRENYPKLLQQMRSSTGKGETVTVGKISLGAIEFGRTTLRLSAENGLTVLSALSSSIYDGTILGEGFVSFGEKLSYRGDFLFNDLSLRAVSRTLPIQGYISGRVDGVMSFSGGGRGMGNLTGFLNLWAHEGKGRKGEKMTVSKEFLQRLAKQKLSGFFFTSDRRYDDAEIRAVLEQGDLTFDTLRIVNSNIFGVRDLNVSIAPGQNRIAIGHLMESIKEAAVRGKPSQDEPAQAPAAQEFKWGE